MAISIENLRKTYGEQLAVDNISFSLGVGELVGFLGPNGAGKSTTMKIMTGFLSPDSGEVRIGDQLMTPDNYRLRREIGYLPEHNPLYLDLYVREYLAFTAGMYGIKKKTAAVDRVVQMTGLVKEQNKKISALSKGYRQRVGLAQALIHDPKLLILDEPTTGLDPNQLEEIRTLIKGIAVEKMVFFSSHIMQEVEAICNRVLIINNGCLIADNSSVELKGRRLNSVQQVELEFLNELDFRLLQDLPFVGELHCLGARKFLLTASGVDDIRPMIFNFAVQHGLVILAMMEKQASLEHVFQQLTS
ncbi:MAG: ATP-binding cassette domain-containing protein [Mangrovibacterium sp.]